MNNFAKNIFENADCDVVDTPTSGDQGVNLLASIEDLRFVYNVNALLNHLLIRHYKRLWLA